MIAKRCGVLLWISVLAGCGADADDESRATHDAGADAATSTDAGMDAAVDRPEGWAYASHDPEAPADYEQLFTDDIVQRIDIVMAADTREAMLADMEQLLGPLGSSGGLPIPGGGFDPPDGGGFQIPPALTEACAELSAGDSCMLDASTEGTCTSMGGDDLLCIPSGLMPPGGGFPGGGGPGGALDLLGGDPIYVPVTLKYEGREWTEVGMRYKGNSSLAGSWGSGFLKIAFRLNFDHYEDEHPEIADQRFYGFKEMTFSSAYGDAAFIRDKLASEILLERGAKAARATFCRVYVDAGEGPEYWGLYTMIEDPSDAMPEAQLGDGSGNVYKPDGTGASFQAFDEASFVKKTNERAADYSDVIEAIEALHASRDDAAAWRERLERAFDVDAFLRALAFSRAIGHWDSYGTLNHNYYLYGDPQHGGRLVWISWDHNFTWQGSGMLSGPSGSLSMMMDEVGENSPLIRYLLDDPVYRQRYVDALDDMLQGAYEKDAFEERAAELHALIAPYVIGEEGEAAPYTHLSSNEVFESSLSDPASGLLPVADQLRSAASEAIAAELGTD